MKRTFSTTFFRRALFLVLLFGGVTNLWGADNIPASITFDWSSKNDNGTYLNSDFSTACCKKAASDGYFYYSHACEDEVKNNAGFSDGGHHISTSKQNVLFRTKNQYHFEKGAYEITITAYGRDGSSMSTPEIYIGDTKYTSKDKTSVNPNWGQTSVVTYQITVPSAGDYYFRGNFANDAKENVGWGEITFAKAGPVAMKRIYMPKTSFDGWTTANAKFAVYSITDSKWQDHFMTSGTGCLDAYYYDDIPEKCEKVIIGRFNPSCSSPTWDSNNGFWSQTEDITLNSNNCITPQYYNAYDPDQGKAHCNLSTFTPPTYAVTYAAGDHGSGTMTDSNSPYACGSDVTVLENEFTAARGYVFNNFSDGSNTYNAGDVISDLQAAKTLTAQWTSLTSYNITASADPSHKGHVNGAGTYYEGETVTLKAVSEDDSKYMFTGWSDDDKSNPRVFTAQNGIATNYVANFISGKKECGKTYTMECEDNFVNVEIINSGNARNTPSKFQATSSSGYGTFSGTGYVWFGSDGEGDAYFPLTIAEDDNISFSTVYCEANGNSWINIYQETNETGDIKYDNVKYKKIAWHRLKPNGGGEWDWKSSFTKSSTYNQSLTAGKYIIGISNGDSGKGRFDKIDFTATKDIFCTVTPAAKCTISYAMNGHGTQIGDVSIEEGETWTAPTPDPTADGWVFDGWKRPNSTGDETLYKSGSTGFTVSGNEELTAQWHENFESGWFMKGTFVDDWETQYDFVKPSGTAKTGSVTLNNLKAGYDYYFKVWGTGDHGCTVDGAKITKGNNVWTLNGNKNVGLTTTAKGSYTFTLDFTDAGAPQITVTYPTDYTITFANGNPSATGTMNDMVNIAENEEVTLTTNNYELSCNHFVKWVDQDSHEYEDGAQVTVTKDLTLTAQWAVNRYKAIYDANGVTGYTGDLPATVEYNCGDQVTISQTPRLSKFGYTFIGWNTDPNATVALADNYQFTIDQGDTKIYAIWNVKKPTGLSIAPETGTYQVTKGTGVQMIVTLTPDASELAEENREVTWSTSNSTFATVNQSGYVNFVGQGSVTITATSKLDGSVSNTYNFSIGAGSCKGWEISAYDKNDKGESSNETMDYFYQVSDTEWRVKYVLPNGTRKFWVGNCDGWWDPQYGGHSKEWDFGWIRLKDRRDNKCGNNTQYAGQDAVGELVIWSNSTDENYGIAFLPNYKISYMTDGSNWRIMDFHNTTGYSYETDIFQVPEGYKTNGNMKYFVGVEKNTGENMMVEEISQQDAMNSVNGLKDADMAGKYGKWHISSNSCDRNWYCEFNRYYQVRFEMNGGDGNIDPMYFVGDNSQSFNTNTLTNPTRTGYELTGWKDQEDHTYTTSQNITVTKDLVLTAQWTAKDYAITLDKNNGSTDGSASAKYDSNTLNSISHVGARTGYTLTGYFTLAENGSQVITKEGALVASAPDYTDENSNWKKASNCTLYAQWTANKYNVNFDFDGGADGKSSIEVTYDAAMPTVAPLPTREFYDFAGYYTEKNGQGTQYYTVSGTSAHVWDITTDNTTLYAYWTPKSYAITWNFDGGHATSDDYTQGDVPYGTTIKAPTVEKTGYNFNEWNPAVGTMPGAATTYTAQWTAKTYNLTLDANGGSANGRVTVTYDSNTTSDFSAPTRDNYIVEGFYAENGCTTKVMNADGSLVENVSGYTDASGNWIKDATCTLYTKWAEKPKVDALIVTGDVNNATHNNGGAGFTYTHPDDAFFGHKVLKIEYSNMSGSYGNSIISIDNGYQSSSSTGATGFGFWYKTDAGVTSIAFCFDYNEGSDQKKTQLPGTNGAWKYVYVASSHANGWNGSNIIIWMNGTDDKAATGNWTPSTLPHSGETTNTNPSSGVLYISEIRATEITEKFINYTVNVTPPSQGSTSAQTVGGETITSGTKVPEGTQVIFTWNEESGYDFVKFNDGTTDYTNNPCTLTVNSDLTVTTTVEVAATKHTLTVNAGEHGSVSPTSKQVGEGHKVTITATPADGYLFDKWTSTDVELTEHDTDNPLTITMPTNDVTLTATWKVNYCKSYLQLNCVDYDESKVTYISSGTDGKATISKHDTYYATITSDGAIYLPVTLPAGTYYIKVSGRKDNGSVWMNYFTQGSGNDVTYNGENYGKTNWHNVGSFGNSFEEKTVSWDNQGQNITLNSETKLLFSITGHTNADYEWIRIYKTSGDPFCPTMYTVNFAADPSDKGTVTAAIKNETITTGDEVPENTVVVFTANVTSGYEVVNWTDGSKQLAGAVNSFEQTITDDITVTANIEEIADKYAVTATAGDHGTITSGAGDYPENATVTIVTAPDANYKVGSAAASNVDNFTIEGNNVSFTMPAAAVDVTINFVFDTVHNIIATGTSTNVGSQIGNGENGSINVSSITDPTGHFTHNVLDYNYSMPNWGSYCGYSLPTDANYTTNSKATGLAFWYIADDNVYMEIKVNGEKVFKLSSTNGEWHYIYYETSDAATGTSFEIWMNYQKDSWQMTKTEGHVYFSEIQATNVTYQEPIVPKVNLTVEKNPVEGGNVTTSPAVITNLEKGTPVTLTAAPKDNYRFENWTVNDVEVSTEATYVRTVNATETITANFVRVYTLTINNDGNGTATVSPNQTKFAEGDEITVTSVPNSGYKFKAWLDDSDEQESTDDPYTFTMPASDKTLKVTFEESINYYDINTAVSGEGTVTIKVDGETHSGQQILEGTQVTLTATPNSESYAFTQWQDGNTDNPRTITANATNAGITWTATFTQAYTVSVELGAPGKEVIGEGMYGGGAKVTLTAVAATEDSQGKAYDLEYQLKEWTAQGVDISGHEHDNPLTFTMPYTNVTLTATFAPVECVNTYTIQCEDLTACLSENDSKLTTKPFNRCKGGGCMIYNDHYTGYHGEGYWDFKEASNMAMYYPVVLEPGTYSFTVWNTTDDVARGCWMYIYTPSETDVVLTYDGQNFKETAKQNVDFYKPKTAYFGEGGTISNINIPERQKVFIALYASDQWSAWDQIVITANQNVFCAPLPTTDFVIKAGETKEIPVCGVDNLTIYDGGQANNNDNVEVFKQVKYSRTVNDLDKWETFAVPYDANEITVQDLPHNDLTEYTINPIYGEEGKYTAGYFYMEELKGEDATLVGRPFATRWEISLKQYPQQNVPYIIRFPHEQSDGYFANTQINYKYDYARAGGASVILTGKKNATIIEEDYPGIEAKPTFYFYANNTLANIQLETSAYILNESGMNFDIVDQPVIPPFHCYVQATQEIKQLYPRLAMRRDDSGGGVTTELIPISVEEMNAAHVEKFIKDDMIYILRDNKIYTVMGQPVK